MNIVLVTAAALINADARVLLQRRPEGKTMAGLWEFPGGKLERQETPELGLARELKEELNITVLPEDLRPLTFASHSYEDFHLLMPVYTCRKWAGDFLPREGQIFTWAAAAELISFDMPPADIPLIDILQRELNR